MTDDSNTLVVSYFESLRTWWLFSPSLSLLKSEPKRSLQSNHEALLKTKVWV